MKNKIKILFFVPSFYMGGAEKVAVNMIRLLDKELFDIHLVTLTNDGPLYELVPQHISLHTLNVSKTIFSIFRLRKILLKLMPDVIFSTLNRTHTALDMALIGFKKRPITIFRNETSPKLVIAEKSLSFTRLFLLKIAYKHATFILAQTPEMKKEMMKYFGVKGNKIQVFVNPLDILMINDAIENIDNPFDSHQINVVALGRLSKEKAVDTLLRSFRIVVDKNKNFVLHIIGRDGGEKKKLMQLVKDLSLEKNVKFWGEQSNPYKFIYFSDLYVLSSTREGLPNTVLESLYLKKPVVSTKCIPFMSQLIDDGKNGFLVDVGNTKQLAEAILKFKNIDTKINAPLVYESDVNKLFLDVLKYFK